MDKVLATLALGLGLLGAGNVWAVEHELRLPLGPEVQTVALEWAGEFTLEKEGGPLVRDVQIAPLEIRYLIATQTSPDAASVTLKFEPNRKRVVIEVKVEDSKASPVAELVKVRLQEATSAKRLRVLWPEKEETKQVQETEARGPPWWREVEKVIVLLLLVGLALGLLLSWRILWTKLRQIKRQDAWALGVLQFLLCVALWVADDTVLYHSGHGWALAELIHQASTSDPHAGALAPLWSYLLGWPGSAGQEAFFASRVGLMLSIWMMWSWILLMSGSRSFAWISAVTLLAQPAFFLAARSEYVASPGLALLLLTLNLLTLAGRERDWRLILAAASALGLLASFRALGPVVWPFVGLFLLVSYPIQTRKRLKTIIGASLVVGLCAAPSLLRVLGVGTSYMPKEGLSVWPDFGQTQLLGDPLWTGPLLGFAALLGGVLWILRREDGTLYRSRLAAVALLGMVWAIVYATQHVAGTYLNTPRYHLWLLVPASASIGYVGGVLVRRGRRIELAGYAGCLLVLGTGLIQPWTTSLERHPESRQLDAWRAATQDLPRGATLIVPERRGEHEIKLPMTELMHMRPDIKIQRRAAGEASGIYAFKPLDCLRPSLQPGDAVRDDCRMFASGWRPVEEATRGTSWRVRSIDGEGDMEASTDADYWVYPALSDPPGLVGLFTR